MGSKLRALRIRGYQSGGKAPHSKSDLLGVRRFSAALVFPFLNNTLRQAFKICETRTKQLKSRVHRVTFKCQHAEDAFMHTAQRLFPYEPFQAFDAKCEFSKGKRAFVTQTSVS